MEIKTSERIEARLIELQEGIGNGEFDKSDFEEFSDREWVSVDDITERLLMIVDSSSKREMAIYEQIKDDLSSKQEKVKE